MEVYNHRIPKPQILDVFFLAEHTLLERLILYISYYEGNLRRSKEKLKCSTPHHYKQILEEK